MSVNVVDNNITVTASQEVEVANELVTNTVVNEYPNTISVKSNEFAVVGDGLFATTKEEVPGWMRELVGDLAKSATANTYNAMAGFNYNLYNAMIALQVAENKYQQTINTRVTDQEAFVQAVETLNSTVQNAEAEIVGIKQTYATKDFAVTTVAQTLEASLNGGAIKSSLGQLASTMSNQYGTMAQRMDVLESTFEDLELGVEGYANATSGLETFVGKNAPGTNAPVIASSKFYQDLNVYLEGTNYTTGGTNTLVNQVTAAATGVESKFEYNSSLKLNGATYNSGFGLATSLTPGSGLPTGASEFWINADKFKMTTTGYTGPKYSPFTVDGTNGSITFNGKVVFGNNQTGTIDEAIAAGIESVVVGDKNINITDNLIPTTSLVTDVNNAGYQFVGDPVKGLVAGIDTFAEVQLTLDGDAGAVDEVYSPYVDEVTMPYYYRFGIKGITTLTNKFYVTLISDTGVVSYHNVVVTLEPGMTLYANNWYIVDGIINPVGAGTGTSGRILTPALEKVATISNFNMVAGTTKVLLGWVGSCTISRMKLAKITADTFTGSVATVDYVEGKGYVVPEDLGATGTTVIDGGRIITGYISADRIAAEAITADKLSADSVTANKIAAGAVGSINIASTLQSDNYVAGNSGWRLSKVPDILSEFNSNVAFRGNVDVNNLTGAVLKPHIVGEQVISTYGEPSYEYSFNHPSEGIRGRHMVVIVIATAESEWYSYDGVYNQGVRINLYVNEDYVGTGIGMGAYLTTATALGVSSPIPVGNFSVRITLFNAGHNSLKRRFNLTALSYLV